MKYHFACTCSKALRRLLCCGCSEFLQRCRIVKTLTKSKVAAIIAKVIAGLRLGIDDCSHLRNRFNSILYHVPHGEEHQSSFPRNCRRLLLVLFEHYPTKDVNIVIHREDENAECKKVENCTEFDHFSELKILQSEKHATCFN